MCIGLTLFIATTLWTCTSSKFLKSMEMDSILDFFWRTPYEVVILPMNHVSDFSHLDRDQRRGIKETLTRIVPAIADISGPDGFEIYLRTQPLIPRHGYPEFLRGADLADVYHTGLTVRSCKGAQRI